MNSKHILSLLLIVPLIACAHMTPEQQAALQQDANQPVTCKAGPDCEEKWSRAVQWVKQNSEYKFQTVSDNVIQTMGPLAHDPSAAFTITKVATGHNTYEIDFDGGCDAMFGCMPSLLASKASFVDYVMGPEATPKP